MTNNITPVTRQQTGRLADRPARTHAIGPSDGQTAVARGRLARCFHLAGADGTGKTTQSKTLLSWLEGQGIKASYAWLRFPRFFCMPLLVYARLRGYSHQERTVEGNLHGYWNFQDSWLMRNIFPWALLLDAFVLGLTRLYIPLWQGYTMVCDRFAVDILADLMVGVKDPHLDERLPGKLFLALLPRGTRVTVLDLEPDIAVQRSPELRGDRSQPMRRTVYLELAARHGWPVISAQGPREAVTAEIIAAITGDGCDEARAEQRAP